MKTELKQLIPEHLDIDEFLKNNPPKFKYKRDKFIHILNLLTEKRYFINDEEEDERDETTVSYTNIHSTTLQDRIYDYPNYIRYLEQHKIIEIHKQYIVRVKAMGYRISKVYRGILKPIHIADSSLIKNIKKKKKQVLKHHEAHLRKWLNDKLTINYDNALNYLQQKYETDVSKKEEKKTQEAERRGESTE